MARQKLTKRTVDAAAPNALRYTFWDAQVPGFGIRITSSGVKTFILRYGPKESSGKKRYLTLGRYGIVTVEEAREAARRKLGAVANGEDPVRDATERRTVPTLAVAAAEFLATHVSLKRKPKTAASYTHALEHHIIPKLGERKLSAVTKSEVSALHSSGNFPGNDLARA